MTKQGIRDLNTLPGKTRTSRPKLVTCPTCDGEGTVHGRTCPECLGTKCVFEFSNEVIAWS